MTLDVDTLLIERWMGIFHRSYYDRSSEAKVPDGMTYDKLIANCDEWLTTARDVKPDQVYGMLLPNGDEPALLTMGLVLEQSPVGGLLGMPRCVSVSDSGTLLFDNHCVPWSKYEAVPGGSGYVLRAPARPKRSTLILVHAKLLPAAGPVVTPDCETCSFPERMQAYLAWRDSHLDPPVFAIA